MAKLAVFLGAGASRVFGYPLTRDILPRIVERLDGTLFGADAADRQDLKDLLTALLPGLAQTPVDRLPLITDVLSQVDFAVEERLSLHPSRKAEDMSRFRRLLERGVYETITTPAPANSPILNRRFRDWLRSREGDGVAIISSNYDVSVDSILFAEVGTSRVPSDIDFGFSWRQVTDSYDDEIIHLRPAGPRFRLYKLHGSLNWVRCPLCEQIYINPYGDIAAVAFARQRDAASSCHCGYWPLQMQIVAPSYARQSGETSLSELWRNALQFLREADEWVLIGYSFPAEDLALRALFTRAFHGRFSDGGAGGQSQPRPVRIRVIQEGNDAKWRYRTYLDSPSRPGLFTYDPKGLEAFLESQPLRFTPAQNSPPASES